MKCTTEKTFSGLDSYDMEISCGMYNKTGEICWRETKTGNKLTCKGMSNATIRDAVLLFVRSQESHKDKPEVRRFLKELSEGVNKSLADWHKEQEAEWES